MMAHTALPERIRIPVIARLDCHGADGGILLVTLYADLPEDTPLPLPLYLLHTQRPGVKPCPLAVLRAELLIAGRRFPVQALCRGHKHILACRPAAGPPDIVRALPFWPAFDLDSAIFLTDSASTAS